MGNFSLAGREGAVFGVSKVYFEMREIWKDLCESLARDVTAQFIWGEGRRDGEERVSCLARNQVCRAIDEGYNAVRCILVLQDR